jgi:transcriptional regulator of arginine metabolism
MPAESESREKRQAAILEILRQRPVARQTQLVGLLKDRGILATQSSVSRDLRQLGVTKLDQGYAHAAPERASAGPDQTMIGGFVRDIQTAGANLTVVKTAVGAAQRVAVHLDRSDWPEIVGTLSGDDTIFVATRNGAEQRRLVTKLRTQFEGL